jgi:hypothetical protein
MKSILVFLVLLVAVAHSVAADIVYLKDGSMVEGTVTGLDSEAVAVNVRFGTLTIKKSDVTRIDFGEARPDTGRGEPEPAKPEMESSEEPEQIQKEEEGLQEPMIEQERTPKSANTAAALAVIPGGGYAYLDRWDMAAGAVAIEAGLAGLGISLVSGEGEGKNSTGYIVLGFLGLLKIAEIVDCRDRAVDWNRTLDVGFRATEEEFCIGFELRL